LACDQKVEGSIPKLEKILYCKSVEKLSLSEFFLSFAGKQSDKVNSLEKFAAK
jgi:hypothetical protein